MSIPKNDSLKRMRWIENQRKAQIGVSRNAGENNPFFGKKHSEKTRAVITMALTGKRRDRPNRTYLPSHLNKEIIEQLYPDYSVIDIANKLDTTEWYIRKALKQWSFSLRNRSETLKLANRNRPVNGRIITKEGYVRILKKDHPRASSQGYVWEHILVWEMEHQRYLPEGLVIHHLNGIKNDNRIINLFALERKKHHYALYTQELQAKIRCLEEELRLLKGGNNE